MVITKYLISLPRFHKRAISILIDIFGLAFLTILSIWLRFGDSVFPVTEYVPAIILLPLLALPVFILQGLYRAVVRYIGYRFVMTVFISVTSLFVFWAAIIYLADLQFPRSAIVINWMLALLYIAGTRLVARWLLSEGLTNRYRYNKKRVVIYGAGTSGQQLLSAMKNINSYKVVGFIDDSKQLQKHDINSVRVYSRNEITYLISQVGVSEIFLAVPSANSQERRSILNWLEGFHVKVSTLPAMDQFIGGKVSFSDVREIEVEDLLGRDPVIPNADLLCRCVHDHVVMVTGAGGSIGSELSRQILKESPKMIILYEMSEFALYKIEHELMSSPDLEQVHLIPVLGNVNDENKLRKIIDKYGVNTIYHAAAYKHVPIVEHNIQEGILNNSFGTKVLAEVAADKKVKNFVLISTDKAVRPTNIMGASKRLAEMVLQALQVEYPETRFVMVRFGNVLDSSGSVIPLFRRQIEAGGPVTVTHKEITRYFMTIPEAASLVIQAGSMGQAVMSLC